MHKKGVMVAAAWLVLGAAVLGWLSQLLSPATAAADVANSNGIRLPIILKPANTPTPTPRPTRVPPAGGNWIDNGSFEGDQNWTNIITGYGNLVNQQPNGWLLDWVDVGQPLYDARRPSDIAGGVAESLHKSTHTLPPDEWAGGPDALILEGTQTYKTFHAGTSFGTELRQTVANLPAGRYRLTMPVNLHWHENLDPDGTGWDHETAESAAFVFIDGVRYGRWANALEMGDRTWYYHEVEFEVADGTDVTVVLQFKSRYAHKDFFIDAVELRPIGD